MEIKSNLHQGQQETSIGGDIFNMPMINTYQCNSWRCRFSMPSGWGMYMYVLDDDGRRVPCGHPRELDEVESVLGGGVSLETIRERTGFNSHCVCLGCRNEFDADLGESYLDLSKFKTLTVGDPRKTIRELPEYKLRLASPGQRNRFTSAAAAARDKRECPRCMSTEVKTELELVGEPCPKCGRGMVEERFTGQIS
jgi:hypothetical protein